MKKLLPAASRLLLVFLLGLHARPDSIAQSVNIIPPNSAGNGQFGYAVTLLQNGNFVVADPFYDEGAVVDIGAVYLYNGATLAMISMLKGSNTNDRVGLAPIVVLSNGNYLVRNSNWKTGTGAVTWCSSTAGTNGVVSAANSLTGSTTEDGVGIGITLLSNGNYVVKSPTWKNGGNANAGAVTWGSGTAGITSVVSTANSLVGSNANDEVGAGGITVLNNGNYIVSSQNWDNGSIADVGAATWGNGTTGISGVVTTVNSLVGSSAGDQVGNSGISALNSGNYVVRSTSWKNGANAGAGAVTWGDGSTGISGLVSAANSLAGSNVNDQIGSTGITLLSNGNYIVRSAGWKNGSNASAGAATWGSGTAGISGVVSAANSLVGSHVNDQVGSTGITVLNNSNYTVRSQNWDNGGIADAGAVTWGNGSAGISGLVSAANSLIGSNTNDVVGNTGITALSNGNYVVRSPNWDNGSLADVGAATWGNGSTGINGLVSAANSLVGTSVSDQVGGNGITALSNGNYVVRSQNWDNGSITDVGAATWGNGTIGTNGLVSIVNSLVGSSTGDQVGNGGITALPNGSYVVSSQSWDNGSIINAGAATWGSSTAGISGVVSVINSLAGSSTSDQVGSNGITILSNGNYVANSTYWDNGSTKDVGAITWGSGAAGVTGVVSARNSLVGSSTGDNVGLSGISALSNGNYIVNSTNWDNSSISNAGAVTWGSGTAGINGAVTTSNSLIGSSTNDQVGSNGITALGNGSYIVRSQNWDNGSKANAGAVTLGNGSAGMSGYIHFCNSIVGNIAGGISMKDAYNTTYNYLIAGKPAENLVTRFFPSGHELAEDNNQAIISVSSSAAFPVPFIDSACRLLAAVKPTGISPVNGTLTAKAHVQSSSPVYNGQALVRRNVEITPAANSDIATATPTLYFTQADFDDYNATNTNGSNLPTGPFDAAGIANLKVNQQHGTSLTGLPGSYTGFAGSGPASLLIDPADTSILWNSNLNRWEVSFDITGFSGFFVYTGNGSLSLAWLDVSGVRIDKNKVQVAWKVHEQQVNSYTVERSTDGIHFTAIGTFSSKGNGTNTYFFTDAAAFSSGNKAVYYRIQQQDADGKTGYSKTVQLSGDGSIAVISIYPNPFHAAFTVRSSTVQSCTITDNAGRTLLTLQLASGANTIQSANWAAGTYFLKTKRGVTYKLVKTQQ